ncbi:MAG: IS4 family transposase [Candidatus Omnitrophota bacterium]
MERTARIQPVEKMVEKVYGAIQLGDPRRKRRLLQVAIECVKHPGASFGQIYGKGKEIKGAYRLIENKQVKSSDLLQPLERAGGEACAGREKIYAVQDTTELDFSHREAIAGLGPIHTSKNPGQGMFLHSTLAVDEEGTPLGFLGLQTWTRDAAEMGKREKRRKRPIEEKESHKWLEGMEGAQRILESLPREDRPPYVIHVMDREGDIFEVFESAYRLGCGVVVRAAWDRNVEGEEKHLWEAMKSRPAGGEWTLPIAAKPGQAARTARVEIRWGRVILKPPRPRSQGKAPIAVYAVWVIEPNPPKGATPVEWMLLTTEPAAHLEEAMEIVEIYRRRWRVEDLHLILKSGCRIEKGQYNSREAIEKVLALYLLSALRILILRYLAETQPESAADLVLNEVEQKSLRIYVRHQFGQEIVEKMTVYLVRYWIGRIGGHLGRKRDGQPGVRTLWRGWRDFELIVSMYIALTPL